VNIAQEALLPMPAERLSLEVLNHATEAQFVALLEGIYEHSPWVARGAASARPYRTLPALRQGLITAVRRAGREAQLALLRAHPELAGKAMVAGTLTAESTGEQSRAGLTHCSPEEFARLQQLNRDYNARFGFPFILAVRGPRGQGLDRTEIIRIFERRLAHPVDHEFEEALRNVHRIAEVRLAERFGVQPQQGDALLAQAEALAGFSDPGFAGRGELTVTYLTDAHRACAQQLAQWMREAGFDEVGTDAVGNVVGRYAPDPAAGREARWLMTGSHYDTVRNGGRYDGRPRAERGPPAATLRHRTRRVRRRGGPALQGDLSRLGRTDRRFRSALAGSDRCQRCDDAGLDAVGGAARHDGGDRGAAA
jgi:N-carbamoyl-L-amino-acid hydrolase